MLIAFSITACAPNIQSVQADLLKVQADLAIIAANAQPVVKVATKAAVFAETATGNPELVPITNAVSAAVEAANVAIAKTAPGQ